MTHPALRLQRLAFFGSDREPVEVPFRPGLNIVVGPSETGKSFLVEAIDFMLGGGRPLRESPERQGYDTIVLELAISDGRAFTLQRSTQGGPFLFQEGAHERLSRETATPLRDKHSASRTDNLSAQLLDILGLREKIVRRAKGETRPLSFRDLAFLVSVDETRIWSVQSPVLSGQYTESTVEKAVFKLALTGVDDSSLVAVKAAQDEAAELEARRKALLAVIADREAERNLQVQTEAKNRLDTVLERLTELSNDVDQDEKAYAEATRKRRRLGDIHDAAEGRVKRIAALLERFDLLDRHYRSDLARLHGIAEAAGIFSALHPAPCPFCGAAPDAQRHGEGCDVDASGLAAAALAEIERIKGLRIGLLDTKCALEDERASTQVRAERAFLLFREEDRRASQLSITLRDRRRGAGDLNREASQLRSELFQHELVSSLRNDVAKLEADIAELKKGGAEPEQAIPVAATTAFAEAIEKTLKAWNFPDAARVAWEAGRTDVTIGNRDRGDRGKGLRAITCAAFVLTLLDYCRSKGNPHVGFVTLDSPLLAYWKPEGDADNLMGTDVDERFYRWLIDLPSDRQTVIIENKSLPDWLPERANVIRFTKNPQIGRYGLFPVPE